MKILITGANGQLGQSLVKKIPKGWDFLALNRNELDITDKSAVLSAVNSYKPDYIINSAAYTAVDRAETESKLCFKVNSDGPKFLSEAANSVKSTLIHLSTDYVFGGHQLSPYKEDDSTLPNSIYGRSKLAGEREVLEACKKHIIIRTAWVFGEYGHNFVKTMIKHGRNRETMSIVDDQFGGPTYTGDIADAIIKVIMKLEITDDHDLWGVYHLSGLPHASWYDFAQEIFSAAKMKHLMSTTPILKPIPTSSYPTPAERPRNSKLDCTKIYEVFGIEPSNWKVALSNIQLYK